MNAPIPPEFEAYARDQVAAGSVASEAEAVADALLSYLKHVEDVRALIDPALAEIERGDAADALAPDLPPRTVRFVALYDDEADVWTATSEDRISTEAATRDDLLVRLKALVPDLLESRDDRTGPVTIVVDWKELRTVEQTTMAIA